MQRIPWILVACPGLFLLSALPACKSITTDAVPINIDSMVVSAIPRDGAKQALADVLERSWTRRGSGGKYSRRLEKVDVGDDSFAFEASVYRGLVTKQETRRVFRYMYREINPTTFEAMLTDSFMISLYGNNPGPAGDPLDDCFWCETREDAKTFLEAYQVLKSTSAIPAG